MYHIFVQDITELQSLYLVLQTTHVKQVIVYYEMFTSDIV